LVKPTDTSSLIIDKKFKKRRKEKIANLAPTRFASPSMFSVPITLVFIVCKVIPLNVR